MMSGAADTGAKLGYASAGGDKQAVNLHNANLRDIGNEANDRSTNDYTNFGKSAYDTKGQVTSKYWDLYNQAGEDSGGGGVGAYVPTAVRFNESMEGYRNLAKTGGWTPEDIAAATSIATASGEGLYQGLKNQMSRSSAGVGVPVYSSTLQKMGRDSAYQSNKSNMEANLGIQSDIRNRKQVGLEGVSTWDKDYMNQVAAENARKQAYNSAAAGARANAGARRRSEQAKYLDDIAGLNNDIPYWNLREGTQDLRLGSEKSVDPTPAKTGLKW